MYIYIINAAIVSFLFFSIRKILSIITAVTPKSMSASLMNPEALIKKNIEIKDTISALFLERYSVSKISRAPMIFRYSMI
jgi:hypothetical protein